MTKLLQRLRTFLSGIPAAWLAGLGVAVLSILLVFGLIFYQAQSNHSELKAKDMQIATAQKAVAAANTKLLLVGNAYAALRDQEFSLGITPAAGTLTQVENPGTPATKAPVVKSFTAAIPDPQVKGGQLYYTCTDKTGLGNFQCSDPIVVPTTPAAKQGATK